MLLLNMTTNIIYFNVTFPLTLALIPCHVMHKFSSTSKKLFFKVDIVLYVYCKICKYIYLNICTYALLLLFFFLYLNLKPNPNLFISFCYDNINFTFILCLYSFVCSLYCCVYIYLFCLWKKKIQDVIRCFQIIWTTL